MARSASLNEIRDSYRWMARVIGRVSTTLEPVVQAECGLTLIQYRALECVHDLGAHGRRAYVRQVATNLGVSDATASRAVRVLERRAPPLLARGKSPLGSGDLTLTSDGERLRAAAEPTMTRALRRAWLVATDPARAQSELLLELSRGTGRPVDEDAKGEDAVERGAPAGSYD